MREYLFFSLDFFLKSVVTGGKRDYITIFNIFFSAAWRYATGQLPDEDAYGEP